MAKKRWGRYTDEFKRMCVERMKECEEIGALAKELNINRRQLYRWRAQLDPVEKGEWATQEANYRAVKLISLESSDPTGRTLCS